MMNQQNQKVVLLTQAAVIAALYVVLTLVFAPVSFGTSGVELRVSECLTVLPFFTPAAVPGLFVGCLIANILGGGVVWDILFGSLATLVGAAIARKLRRNRWLVPIPTVIANTVVVPLVLRYGYGVNLPIALLVLSVFAGEVLGCCVLGEIFLSALLPLKRYVSI